MPTPADEGGGERESEREREREEKKGAEGGRGEARRGGRNTERERERERVREREREGETEKREGQKEEQACARQRDERAGSKHRDGVQEQRDFTLFNLIGITPCNKRPRKHLACETHRGSKPQTLNYSLLDLERSIEQEMGLANFMQQHENEDGFSKLSLPHTAHARKRRKLFNKTSRIWIRGTLLTLREQLLHLEESIELVHFRSRDSSMNLSMFSTWWKCMWPSGGKETPDGRLSTSMVSKEEI